MNPFPNFILAYPEADIPLDGVRAWLLQGQEDGEVVFVHFEKETVVPEHAHGEQWEIVLEGSVEMTMNGETRNYGKGESFHIPASVPHSGLVHAGYRSMIVFEERDRYVPK